MKCSIWHTYNVFISCWTTCPPSVYSVSHSKGEMQYMTHLQCIHLMLCFNSPLIHNVYTAKTNLTYILCLLLDHMDYTVCASWIYSWRILCIAGVLLWVYISCHTSSPSVYNAHAIIQSRLILCASHICYWIILSILLVHLDFSAGAGTLV